MKNIAGLLKNIVKVCKNIIVPAEAPAQLGLTTTAAMRCLAPAIEELKCQHGGSANVSICSSLPLLLKGILGEQFDAAIIHGSVDDERFWQFTIKREKLVWISHREFCHDKKTDWQETCPVITCRRGRLETVTYGAYIQQGFTGACPAFCDMEGIKSGILDKLGIGVLPESMVEQHLEEGLLVRLAGGFEPETRLTMIVPRHKEIRPQIRHLLELVAKVTAVTDGRPLTHALYWR